jgi:hypothetical protein
MLNVGDRVRFEPGTDTVDPFATSWPGRIGFVRVSDNHVTRLKWDDSNVVEDVPTGHLRPEPPYRCGSCGGLVFLGRGCTTGTPMEFVSVRDGTLVMVDGRGIAAEAMEARMMTERLRRAGRDMAITHVATHWQRCPAAPKRAFTLPVTSR